MQAVNGCSTYRRCYMWGFSWLQVQMSILTVYLQRSVFAFPVQYMWGLPFSLHTPLLAMTPLDKDATDNVTESLLSTSLQKQLFRLERKKKNITFLAWLMNIQKKRRPVFQCRLMEVITALPLAHTHCRELALANLAIQIPIKEDMWDCCSISPLKHHLSKAQFS